VQEEGTCLDLQTYQLSCAGCYDYSKGLHNRITVQKPVKNTCPNGYRCVENEGTTYFGNHNTYVYCTQILKKEWVVSTSNAQDTKQCGGGITNNLGINVGFEAKVDSLSSDGSYGVEAGEIQILKNAVAIDSRSLAYTLTADSTIGPHGSVQGCIITQGNYNQVLKGVLSLFFLQSSIIG
jgi:hypothetical protein